MYSAHDQLKSRTSVTKLYGLLEEELYLSRLAATRAIKEHTPDSMVLLACTKCRRGRRVRPRELRLDRWPTCCEGGQVILVPEMRTMDFIEEAPTP